MMPGHPGRALHVIANATIQPPSLASSGDWPGRAMAVIVSAIDQYRSCGEDRLTRQSNGCLGGGEDIGRRGEAQMDSEMAIPKK